jgi:hypothetical protein
MTQEEYKELESLLNKLNIEIGYDKRICIIPNYVHDGYCLGVYNSSTGHLQDEYVGATIESIVNKIISPMIWKK